MAEEGEACVIKGQEPGTYGGLLEALQLLLAYTRQSAVITSLGLQN